MSIPTDCPQRNERLGWAGDISVFSRTSTYLADVSQFLRRYLQAMRDVQRKDGRFADVAPLGVGFGGLLWGSAGITVPWEIYQQYGDEAVLSEHYALNLVNTVKRENTGDDGKTYPQYSLMTGFIGTAWISKALSDNGYDDVAYNLLQQTSYPSWLYSVEQGATTIWERLNSYTHVYGFGENNRMNSFNHYSFGAVGAWMYAYSLGIMRDEANPGFKHFILSPRIDPTGKMTFAEGYFDSLYGRIESAWTVIDGKIIYSLTVPANTTASLCIPAKDMESILENGKSIQKAEGILSSEFNDGKAMIELGSGKYEFTVIR